MPVVEIETVPLITADGVRLTADVIDGPTVANAVVVAHPHPLYGGDRFNHVVDAVWRAVGAQRQCALRFDFRGAGDSRGEHGGGGPERADVVAAIDEVRRRHGAVPVWLVGYSFGALVAAEIDDGGVAGWVLIAPPLTALPEGHQPACARDARPCVVVVPQHDEFCPPARAADHCDHWTATRLVTVPTATHSLVAQGTAVAQVVLEMMDASSAGPTPQHPPT